MPPPAPTETEIQTQISNGIAILEELRLFVGINDSGSISNYFTRESTFTASYEMQSQFQTSITAGLSSLRGNLNSAITSGRLILDPLFNEYGKLIGFPETDIDSILKRIKDRFIDNTLRVTSRQFTFGTPAASGSPAGDGVVNRLNTDEDGLSIETQTADTKTVRCDKDEHSGAPEHQEEFEVTGAIGGPDLLEKIVSGAALPVNKATITALSAADSEEFIQNPSFSSFTSSSGVVSVLDGWTASGALSNLVPDTTNFYRDFSGDTTPAAVAFTDNDAIEQNFNTQDAQFEPDIPIYTQIAYRRDVAGQHTNSGVTITLTMGAVSETVTLTSGTSGWNILRIALGTKNWFLNFNQENPLLKIQITGLTAGRLYIDDVILAPFQSFDGGWLAIVGGATPFLRDDTYTYTDTAVESVIQRWLKYIYNFYLPHDTVVSGNVTWADPT